MCSWAIQIFLVAHEWSLVRGMLKELYETRKTRKLYLIFRVWILHSNMQLKPLLNVLLYFHYFKVKLSEGFGPPIVFDPSNLKNLGKKYFWSIRSQTNILSDSVVFWSEEINISWRRIRLSRRHDKSFINFFFNFQNKKTLN